MKNFHFSRLLAVPVLVFAFAVALSSSLQAKQGDGGDGAPFTGIYAFGDSLTDTGEFLCHDRFSAAALLRRSRFERNYLDRISYQCDGAG